jgi:pimeloyl-ACP methyl ester carboxylesterase
MADDVEAVVRTLGLKRYVIVGHSMGGKEARELAFDEGKFRSLPQGICRDRPARDVAKAPYWGECYSDSHGRIGCGGA